ncbi:hypothetical protein KORDIASMS9_03003 [Kordia sp. SMS9]|uniref:hypothetical protein n=1 Tax=Kordia sp. SMS9 TaxID=2282170 RepID=UPI000E105F68|nr:hypothetical protein [Kordia sp. SMS9]AXG70757.1 hypothetical protein KORDIASMS9_03003 [Kordia sp. SMS9]
MDVTSQTAVVFYQHLGKLFYAMALADKKIKKEEFQAMKKEIALLSLSENYTITDAEIDIEHHITSTFKILYFEKATSQACFDDFVTFKRKYESLFTPSIKKAILKIAGKILASFSNVNKSELMLLAKLSIEFKKNVD